MRHFNRYASFLKRITFNIFIEQMSGREVITVHQFISHIHLTISPGVHIFYTHIHTLYVGNRMFEK